MLKNLRLLLHILRYLGPRWLVYRIWYYLKIKSGIMCLVAKTGKWEDYPLEAIVSQGSIPSPGNYKEYRLRNSPRFFFNPDNKNLYRTRLVQWNDRSLFERSDDIARGTFLFFSHLKVHTGFPPDWHYNYSSQERAPSDMHWSRIDDFEHGDIKFIWELSRFGFVYDLVRVYWRTNNEKYPELFWTLVEDWMANNGPNLGVNWKCGQEATFRVMAWCWGLYGFGDSAISTPERIAGLAKMIFLSGIRIERNIGYAISQKNNHSISEAVGLWTIGLLFPELKNAGRWKSKGKELIETLTLQLIDEEGAFSQNSVNYHRLVLHDLLWAFRLGEINGEPFSKEPIDRYRKATEFLYRMQDDKTGRLPNYGANDGALILPLTQCDYRNFRPVIQSSMYFLHRKRVINDGPWDEELVWLFGPDAAGAPVDNIEKPDLELPKSGYFTFRSSSGFLFTRCGENLFRPGQQDMLHVDIWWNGHNIAVDPGSYSYNAPPPWDKGLGRTFFHNTVTVDDLDQMESYAKFLSFPWVTGSVLYNNADVNGKQLYFEGAHNGYQRLQDPVEYKRGILYCGNDHWMIIDKICGKLSHKYRLHWLFGNYPYQWDGNKNILKIYPENKEYQIHYGVLDGNKSASLIYADENSPRGWWSPFYYYKEPAPSLEIVTHNTSALFYTILGPELIRVDVLHNNVKVILKDTMYDVKLNPDFHDEPLVSNFKKVASVITEVKR